MFGSHSETKCSKRHKFNKFVRTKALLSKSDADWPDEFIASSLKESVKWAGHRSCPKLVSAKDTESYAERKTLF